MHNATMMVIPECTQNYILQYYDWLLVIKEPIITADSMDISINSFAAVKSSTVIQFKGDSFLTLYCPRGLPLTGKIVWRYKSE